eukprot:m.225267 g.225267  ORF g.225267 m.225267 type:complete len:120 (+) comp19203_c0_seq3:1521-1880(+)
MAVHGHINLSLLSIFGPMFFVKIASLRTRFCSCVCQHRCSPCPHSSGLLTMNFILCDFSPPRGTGSLIQSWKNEESLFLPSFAMVLWLTMWVVWLIPNFYKLFNYDGGYGGSRSKEKNN